MFVWWWCYHTAVSFLLFRWSALSFDADGFRFTTYICDVSNNYSGVLYNHTPGDEGAMYSSVGSAAFFFYADRFLLHVYTPCVMCIYNYYNNYRRFHWSFFLCFTPRIVRIYNYKYTTGHFTDFFFYVPRDVSYVF